MPPVTRWTLTDPATAETWQFPINPNKMTSPHAPRNLRIFDNVPGLPDAHAFESQPEPYEWSFSGYIREQAHHDQLLYWSQKVTRVHLTDHFGRTWSIRFTEFSPDEKRPTFHRPWRMDYEVKAIMYGAVA